MPIVSRTEFISRFMDKFTHKAIQELEDKLPKDCCISEQCEQANRIINELTKED